MSSSWCSQAFGWGEQGHRGIADAVQTQLDPATVKAIATIVGTGDTLPPGTLGRLSLWPDQIRPLTKNPHGTIAGFTAEELAEAGTFVTNHPDNTNWHFVDLPPGADQYPVLRHPDPTDPVLPFTMTTDVVHMINRTVEILEADTNRARSRNCRRSPGCSI